MLMTSAVMVRCVMSRYIKTDDAIEAIRRERNIKALLSIPNIDIVRCAECKYYEAKEDWCYWRDEAITADDFCSYGEREGE